MSEKISYVWRVVKRASTCEKPVFDKEITGSIEAMKAIIVRHMWFQSVMDDELFIQGTVGPDDPSVTYVNDLPVVSGYADFNGFSLTMKAEALRQNEEEE